jgi:hypothetical protein
MTLNELKGKYARLSNEIDTLAAEGVRHEARLMRLMSDLDTVHRELCELRLRTFAAPTLREAVSRPEPVVARSVVVSLAPPAAAAAHPPPMLSPALSMAG